jgi:HTH-type transcriptional regulator/antitoxin HigA
MIKPIRNKKDYKNALSRVYELIQRNPIEDSEEYNELEVLSILVEDYEEKNFPIDFPDPVEALKFRLEQMELSQSALADILGSPSRASEILNRKRKLTLPMIRAIQAKLNLPFSALIKEY